MCSLQATISILYSSHYLDFVLTDIILSQHRFVSKNACLHKKNYVGMEVRYISPFFMLIMLRVQRTVALGYDFFFSQRPMRVKIFNPRAQWVYFKFQSFDVPKRLKNIWIKNVLPIFFSLKNIEIKALKSNEDE